MIDQILTVLMWIMIIGVAGLGVFVISLENKFKHRIIIKDIRGGQKNVLNDKFRVKEEKDGTVWWKLKKTKKAIAPFDNSCIESTNKGKIFASCYRIGTDNFIPIKDGFKGDPKEIKDIYKDIDPFTSNQRSMLVNQRIKAEREKKKSVADIITMSIPYVALVMIVAVFLLFFGEAVKPMQEVGDQFVSISDQFEKTAKYLEGAINDKTYYSLENDMSGDLINNSSGGEAPN